MKKTENDFLSQGIHYFENNDLSKAYETFSKLAELGDPKAQHYLGLLYCNSDFEEDYDLAAKWFEKAINQHFSESSYSLGMLHLHSLISNSSFERAIELFEHAFGAGILNGYFELGKHFTSKKQNHEAFKFFSAAAEKNHPPSINAVGIAYSEGLGVDKNLEFAKTMFSKSSELWYGRASVNLAKLLSDAGADSDSIVNALLPAVTFRPELTPMQFYDQSYYSAFDDYLEPLAKNGNALALNYLGEREIFSGIYKLKMHFSRLDRSSLKRPITFDIRIHYCRDLRYAYEEIGDFINQFGPLENFDVLKFSKTKQLELKDFFPDFPNALIKAQEFFELSARKHCQEAYFNLGMMNQFCLETRQNIEEAILYFEQAAKKGHLGAMAELAFMRKAEAIGTWNNELELAAAFEHPKACHELGSFYLQSSSPISDINKGFHFFKILADHRRPDAMYILAQLYIRGIGVQTDLEVAKLLLRESAAMGWSKSDELLKMIISPGDN
jgi:TPR repeat protein